MFIFSIVLLFVTVLFLTVSLPLQAIVFILLVEVFSPYVALTVSSLCIEIFSALYESASIAWSSVNKSVLMSYFEILVPFVSASFNSVRI